MRAEQRKAKTGGTGSGRLTKVQQAIEDNLKDNIKNAKDGFLPGEQRPLSSAKAASLSTVTIASVLHNAQHHANTAPVPKGPPPKVDSTTDGDEDNDLGDEIDAEFEQNNHYKCHPAQKILNSDCKKAFFTEGKTNSTAFYPKNILSGRCQLTK